MRRGTTLKAKSTFLIFLLLSSEVVDCHKKMVKGTHKDETVSSRMRAGGVQPWHSDGGSPPRKLSEILKGSEHSKSPGESVGTSSGPELQESRKASGKLWIPPFWKTLSRPRGSRTGKSLDRFQGRDVESGKSEKPLVAFDANRTKFRMSPFSKSVTKLAMFLSAYMLVSCAVFSPLEGWNWGECMYFSIVTLATVGYGDYAPKKPASRIALVVLGLAALIFVATSIGELLDQLVMPDFEKAFKFLRLKRKEVGIFEKDRQNKMWVWKFVMNLLGILVLMASSTVYSKFLMVDVTNWADAVYFSFVTLATIGYGDIVPILARSKVVVSVLCLFGVPVFAMFLGRMVEIAYGKDRNSQIYRVVGGLTRERFNNVLDFCDEMWRRKVYSSNLRQQQPQPSSRCEITPFEFLCFILCKNEVVAIDDVKAVMDNFLELDVQNDGILGTKDVEEWLRRAPKASTVARKGQSSYVSGSAHRLTDHQGHGNFSANSTSSGR